MRRAGSRYWYIKPPEGYMFIHEAAKKLFLSRSALQRRCREGKVDGAVYHKEGNYWLVPKSYVEKELKKYARETC